MDEASFVAVATVTSRVSTFTSPDGVTHTNEQNIRTFGYSLFLSRSML
jgi:hypothetical protein